MAKKAKKAPKKATRAAVAKKRNPQDTTGRNNNARKREIAAVAAQLDQFMAFTETRFENIEEDVRGLLDPTGRGEVAPPTNI